jgi:hypothetical protein
MPKEVKGEDLREVFVRLVRRILVRLIHKQTARMAYFLNLAPNTL